MNDSTNNITGHFAQDLRARLSAGLTRALGQPVNVISITRERSRHARVFPAEVITARPEHGDRIKVFVKYVGGEQVDHPDKGTRDREPRICQELFDVDADRPVVQCYSA